MNRYVGIES